MDSKKVPLWLVFTNADPLGRNHTVMYKSGDDLRQDALTLQIIRIMEHQWEREGLDLRLSPYGCVATGDEKGFIEIVLNSDTTANITKRYSGGATGAFSKEPMARFLKEHNPTNSEYGEAVETFLRSLAGYCVATYVIGIGDRHNDNVMLSRKGHLFHIDFGHFLGNFKSKLGVKRERAPFVFTPDFAYVLGDKGHPIFERFIDTCCSAYSIVRKHTHLLINLFSLMLSTGIPELRNAEDIDWLRRCLQLEMSEAEAADHFTKQIYVALATRTTQLNNAVHIIAHS
jgi:phosphatidylinositol-4,5-bisphosphate 3-kinase